MKQKRCKCGHMLEYNENVCPSCGMNYGDYQTELIRIKKEKTKNGKIGHNHRRACCNCHSRFAFVHNANLVNNIIPQLTARIIQKLNS